LTTPRSDRVWENASAYERYVGRWSRVIASRFVPWLGVAAGGRWLDVACGTGALTSAIVALAESAHADAIDRSERQIADARRVLADPRVSFEVGDACSVGRGVSYDAVVAGLAFPAVSDHGRALSEFASVVRPGGVVGVYVWDFGGLMEPLKYFWEAATALEPEADEPDDESFAICKPEGLRAAFLAAGLHDVVVEPLDDVARFVDFDDYWTPFLSGDAPGQQHAQSLSPERRAELRERLRATLPVAADGSISLRLRAWAGKGATRRPPES
jgi:SAM-dependent methyltransferase